MAFLFAAITLGFLGSFHCIGMCGPIALALPVHNKRLPVKYFLILSYNLGRIVTYAAFGFLAGIVGKSFVLAGLQQVLSVTVGCILLVGVIFSFKGLSINGSVFFRLKDSLGNLFSKSKSSSFFVIGLLNGLLPCGLVYLGIAGAVATGELLKGTLFMAFFGAGTLPMMILLPLVSSSITVNLRKKIQNLIPFMVTAMALLLILRGLNLGIPYLSPKIDRQSQSASCHPAGKTTKIIRCEVPKQH